MLVGLVDNSLVGTSGENRFDLHELVRQYAAAQLVASGELTSSASAIMRPICSSSAPAIATCVGRRASPGLHDWKRSRITCAPHCSGRLMKPTMWMQQG